MADSSSIEPGADTDTQLEEAGRSRRPGEADRHKLVPVVDRKPRGVEEHNIHWEHSMDTLLAVSGHRCRTL